MGLFGNNSFKDQLLEIEWEKGNGIWNSRLRAYGYGPAGALILLVVVAIIITVGLDQDTNLTWSKVQAGDKLYVEEYFLTDTAERSFYFSRMIRPIKMEDIDTMSISIADKRKMSAQLDTSLKNSIILESSEIIISRDSIFKYGDASIGSYVLKDSITALSDKGHAEKWYEVKPNVKLTEEKYVLEIPKGYLLANKNYYVRPYMVRLTEPAAIKKYKPVVTAASVIPKISTGSAITKNEAHTKAKKAVKKKKHKIKSN